MLQKLLAPTLAVMALKTASAQDTTRANPLTISGSVDVYYRYDFAQTAASNFTSFTNSHNRIEPGMASVKFEHKTSKVDLVADLGFGKRAQEFSYNDEGALAAVKQLYVSYAPNDIISFTAGSWATHVGYELLDPQLNRNYSMSYMFTNGPFSHTGVKADLSLGKSSFMLGVANPSDYKYVPDGVLNRKFLLAQYSYSAGDLFSMYLNYAGGKSPDTSKTNQFDVVLTSTLSKKFSVGYNGTVNVIQNWNGQKNISGKSWWGSAFYFSYDPTSLFGLTLRSEYFNDENQLKIYTNTDEGAKVFANTLSANFRIDQLTLIPELRIDHSTQEIFTDNNGAATTKATNVLLAAVYHF